MHELSILMEVVSQVEAVAKAHGNPPVKAIVLQVGEAASVVPRFLEDCYDVAIHGTSLSNTELVIEQIPAMGRCRGCDTISHLPDTKGFCPACQCTSFELLSGREFTIKEIIVEEA